MSSVHEHGFLSELAEGRGEPLAVYGPSPARVAIGYGINAFFALVIGGGLLGRAIFELGSGFGWWFAWFALAVVAALFAQAILFWYVWRIHHSRVLLYPCGFAVVRRRRVQAFSWSRVSAVHEFEGTLEEARPRPAPGELTGEGRSYTVVRDDGEVFEFNRWDLNTKAFQEFRDVVLREARARGVRLIFDEVSDW